jgi:hypothetical protein
MAAPTNLELIGDHLLRMAAESEAEDNYWREVARKSVVREQLNQRGARATEPER